MASYFFLIVLSSNLQYSYSCPFLQPELVQRYTTELLKEHNRLRALHCAGPLKLNKSISKISQGYADSLVQRAMPGSCDLSLVVHNTNRGRLGENLAAQCRRDGHKDNDMTSDLWLPGLYTREQKSYVDKDGDMTGHFTQLVWNASSDVGFGISSSSACEHIVLVFNFYPPGNVRGRYEANVVPTQKCTWKGRSEGETSSSEKIVPGVLFICLVLRYLL